MSARDPAKLRLLVIGDLPPHVLGGAENQLARLVERWARAGHEVCAMGRRLPDGTVAIGEHMIPTRAIAVPETRLRWLRGAAYAVRLARLLWRGRRRYDLVYCRFLGDAAIVACALKAIGALRIPLVATPANSGARGDAAYVRSIPFARWFARLLRRCEAVNAIAPAIRDEMLALGLAPAQLTEIPNGIELRPLPERRDDAGCVRFVWTGRYAPQKGLDVLLRATRAAADREPAIRLTLCGDGPDRAALAQQVEALGLRGVVTMMDALPHDAVRELLGRSDVFVLPSRWEGLSNSALEALEAGLPVVVTRLGGIDSYVTDAIGWVVAPEDERALADAMVDAARAGAAGRRMRGEHARRLAQARFSMDDVAAAYLDLFVRLVAAKRDRAG